MHQDSLKDTLLIRPARAEDTKDLLTIAKQAGTGMTTVPQTEEAILDRINASLGAFGGTSTPTAKDTFFFVLEDKEGPLGMASIFPNLGGDRPFYSYRLSHIAAQAPETGLTASTDILQLVNDFHGYAEIGTLLVGERGRNRGAGRLLSLSRFMYMGRHLDRFGPNVMAEIRGWFDEDGQNPFWDHIGAKFFDTSFEEADRLSANDFRFISHLMPKFPIYVSLLPEAAREVIGKAHPTSSLAKGLLESEGFTWSRCIDIFDGGPSLECPVAKVRTVADTTPRSLTVSDSFDHIPGAERFIVSSTADMPFVCVGGAGHRDGHTVVVGRETADRAGLRNGMTVLAAPAKGSTT